MKKYSGPTICLTTWLSLEKTGVVKKLEIYKEAVGKYFFRSDKRVNLFAKFENTRANKQIKTQTNKKES